MAHNHDTTTDAGSGTPAPDQQDLHATGTAARLNPLAQRRREIAQIHRMEAYALRRQGLSYRAIATRLGCSPAKACQAVRAELAAVQTATREDAAQAKTLELARLDDSESRLQRLANGSDPQVVVQSERALILVRTRRARLLGLDAPASMSLAPPGESPDLPEMTNEERARRLVAICALANAGGVFVPLPPPELGPGGLAAHLDAWQAAREARTPAPPTGRATPTQEDPHS